jgi:hypothetical protein
VLDPRSQRNVKRGSDDGEVALVRATDTVPETVHEVGVAGEVNEFLGEGDDAAEGEGADGAVLVVLHERKRVSIEGLVGTGGKEGEWKQREGERRTLPVVFATVKPSHSASKNESTSLERAASGERSACHRRRGWGGKGEKGDVLLGETGNDATLVTDPRV